MVNLHRVGIYRDLTVKTEHSYLKVHFDEVYTCMPEQYLTYFFISILHRKQMDNRRMYDTKFFQGICIILT